MFEFEPLKPSQRRGRSPEATPPKPRPRLNDFRSRTSRLQYLEKCDVRIIGNISELPFRSLIFDPLDGIHHFLFVRYEPTHENSSL